MIKLILCPVTTEQNSVISVSGTQLDVFDNQNHSQTSMKTTIIWFKFIFCKYPTIVLYSIKIWKSINFYLLFSAFSNHHCEKERKAENSGILRYWRLPVALVSVVWHGFPSMIWMWKKWFSFECWLNCNYNTLGKNTAIHEPTATHAHSQTQGIYTATRIFLNMNPTKNWEN